MTDDLSQADIDPNRFELHEHRGRGVTIRFVREGVGGVPLLAVHGWPESKRIWWRVIEPLADAGFEVIVPDLRGFGDSGFADNGVYDAVEHSKDLHQLVTEGLGHDRVVLCGGDLGGAVVQDFALRFPEAVARLVLFNSPLGLDREAMAGMRVRNAVESSDYYFRQGTDADALAAELTTPDQRRRYIATFYTSRGWSHPGAFLEPGREYGRYDGSPFVDFHTEPFGDADRLRASFGNYEAAFDRTEGREGVLRGRNESVETLIMYGPSDHVIAPDFDRMAAIQFPNHVGPFILRDCGHFVPWEAPHQLVSAARAFCRDLLGGN